MDTSELILQELQKINGRLDSIEERLESVEESLAETRDGVNVLLGWAEECGNVIKFPLPRIGDRQGA